MEVDDSREPLKSAAGCASRPAAERALRSEAMRERVSSSSRCNLGSRAEAGKASRKDMVRLVADQSRDTETAAASKATDTGPSWVAGVTIMLCPFVCPKQDVVFKTERRQQYVCGSDIVAVQQL